MLCRRGFGRIGGGFPRRHYIPGPFRFRVFHCKPFVKSRAKNRCHQNKLIFRRPLVNKIIHLTGCAKHRTNQSHGRGADSFRATFDHQREDAVETFPPIFLRLTSFDDVPHQRILHWVQFFKDCERQRQTCSVQPTSSRTHQ